MRCLTTLWEKTSFKTTAREGLLISGSKVRVLVRPPSSALERLSVYLQRFFGQRKPFQQHGGTAGPDRVHRRSSHRRRRSLAHKSARAVHTAPRADDPITVNERRYTPWHNQRSIRGAGEDS